MLLGICTCGHALGRIPRKEYVFQQPCERVGIALARQGLLSVNMVFRLIPRDAYCGAAHNGS